MICDMTFKRKWDLGKYSRTVHDEKKNFHCMICDVTIKRKCDLGKHQKIIHDENGKETNFYCILKKLEFRKPSRNFT